MKFWTNGSRETHRVS